MTRRILAIVVAVVLAGLGTVGVLFYALSADQRARDNLTGAVQVAVANKRIPSGTTGARIRDENMMSIETMPKSSLPKDFQTISSIDDKLEKLVVTSNVQPGQLLLREMFNESTTVASGLSLPDGMMAVSVETSVPEQVSGYVQQGSQIAIFVTYDVTSKDGTTVTRTRVLLPKVEVVSVGTYTPSDTTGDTGVAVSKGGTLLVTVAVGQNDAERLIEGVRTGQLYVGLLTDTVTVRPGGGIDNSDGGSGVTPLFP
jgi:pilus assembly protein CpaB